MSEFGVSLTGHKKTLEEGVGTGGGYVAYHQPQQYNFDFSGAQSEYDEKRVARAAAQGNIFGQAGMV